MAVEALVISQFVAAGAMLLLAAWLLFLNFQSTVNRSFAVFLFFRAVVILANRMRAFAQVAEDAQGAVFWEAIREYYLLALAPALLYFWLSYSGNGRLSWRRWRAVVVVAAVLVEGMYAYDHCLNYCTNSGDLTHLGPLSFFGTPGYVLVVGLVGLAILVESMGPHPSPRAAAAFPVAIGLLSTAILEGSFAVGQLMQGPSQILRVYESVPWARAFYVPFALGMGAGFAGVVLAFARAKSNPQARSRSEFLAFVAVLAAVSGFFIGRQNASGDGWLPAVFLLGLWRILLPALVAYALVRHRLFDVDVQVRFAIRGSTLAGIFLAAFFVVNKVTENLVASRFENDQVGIYAGGVVAGLLLFAISPLQKVADRLSRAVVPSAGPVSGMAHSERIDLYRQQAALVWSDGTMGPKERTLLDALRTRLAIPLEDATRLESEAASRARILAKPRRREIASSIAK
jgi:hypothetical protein